MCTRVDAVSLALTSPHTQVIPTNVFGPYDNYSIEVALGAYLV